jgi:hypothetical protein
MTTETGPAGLAGRDLLADLERRGVAANDAALDRLPFAVEMDDLVIERWET